jgi:hypothetical protein
MHSVSGAGAGQGQGGGPGKYGSQASVDGSGASRAPKKRGHGMLGGDNKEVKYEQDLEFSATSRQLNYRRAKEERQKKIKRLKQLQKIQQGQKRRTMKRKMTSWMPHSGSTFNEADEDQEVDVDESATATEVTDELSAIELELRKLQIELAAEKVLIKSDIRAAEIKTAEDLARVENQRKQR